ncbi:MAG: zinc-dependent alcohol dehydrogenase [Phycicoccus sp.]
MRQLNFESPTVLTWFDVPEPTLDRSTAALVRPLAVSTCDFDGVVLAGWLPVTGPVPLGHEGVGEVVDIADGVERFAVGDRVIIPWKISCGSCTACRRGHDAQCRSVAYEACYGWGQASGPWGAFLGDLVAVPWADHMLVPLPENVDPVDAAGLSDNITDGWRAVGPPLAERPGGSVLVAGSIPPGSIGLYAVAAAAALGVDRVVYADHDSRRRAIAATYGATAVDLADGSLRDQLGSERFDVTVDASGDPAILHDLVGQTARAGHLTSTSAVVHLAGAVPLPTRSMYRNSQSFSTGWVHTRPLLGRPDGPLGLLASGRLDPAPVTTAVVPWDDVRAALTEPFTTIIAVRSAVEEVRRSHRHSTTPHGGWDPGG